MKRFIEFLLYKIFQINKKEIYKINKNSNFQIIFQKAC